MSLPKMLALLVLVATIVACAPGEAQAGCGHYLLWNGRPIAISTPTWSGELPRDEWPDAPLGGRSCDGPQCRQRVPLPLPLAPTMNVSTDQLAMTCVEPNEPLIIVEPFSPCDPFGVLPMGLLIRLERPPRDNG